VSVFPNPFNRRTELRVNSALPGLVWIQVFDILGRRVYEDIERLGIGESRIAVDGRKLGGAGVYLVQVMTEGQVKVVKVVYMP
jgi:hypothetical protein